MYQSIPDGGTPQTPPAPRRRTHRESPGCPLVAEPGDCSRLGVGRQEGGWTRTVGGDGVRLAVDGPAGAPAHGLRIEGRHGPLAEGGEGRRRATTSLQRGIERGMLQWYLILASSQGPL